MPTGYTAELMEKGQTFPDFVLTCAHAFGALVMLRDEPLDSPIPEFEPQPYYEEALKKNQDELASLLAMTEEQKIEYGKKAQQKQIDECKRGIATETAENIRLTQMEAKVLCWTPPSKDHEGLKKFMLEQIDVSKNDITYYKKQVAQAEQKEPVQYWRDAVSSLRSSIIFDKEEAEKEIKRVNERNLWVRQLRESLKEHE